MRSNADRVREQSLLLEMDPGAPGRLPGSIHGGRLPLRLLDCATFQAGVAYLTRAQSALA